MTEEGRLHSKIPNFHVLSVLKELVGVQSTNPVEFPDIGSN